MDWDVFAAEVARLGVAPSSRQREQLKLYFELLQEYNQRFNLTAIIDEAEVWRKHFLDSLSAMMVLPSTAKGVDIGSGAGFPGIPLAIMCENLHFVLLDSLQKRVLFLREVANRLGIERRVTSIHGRAEDLAHRPEYREKFDFAISRGVARMVVLCELALPLVREGGIFVAMKGPRAPEEAAEAERAVRLLGGGVIQAVPWTLPGALEKRFLLCVPKVARTPAAYPRQAGTPEKKPLL